MSKDYKVLTAGDWVAFEPTILTLACCDCALVHRFELDFRGRKFGFTIRSDRRATKQLRKRLGVVIKQSATDAGTARRRG